MKFLLQYVAIAVCSSKSTMNNVMTITGQVCANILPWSPIMFTVSCGCEKIPGHKQFKGGAGLFWSWFDRTAHRGREMKGSSWSHHTPNQEAESYGYTLLVLFSIYTARILTWKYCHPQWVSLPT